MMSNVLYYIACLVCRQIMDIKIISSYQVFCDASTTRPRTRLRPVKQYIPAHFHPRCLIGF
jgi:hypothetical protein